MIEFLKIENLALMRGAQIEFESGFTVVSGETGAGKSVLLGALALLSGARANREAISAGADSCRVEGVLRFPDTDRIDALLRELGLPECEDGTLVLSRTIDRERSGRIFVNSALAPLSALSKIGELWIDFHGPGEPQKLFHAQNQLEMLDVFARSAQKKAEYLGMLSERAALQKRRGEYAGAKKLSADEAEFLKSQIASIDALDVSDANIARIEERAELAEAASAVAQNGSAVCALLDGDDGAVEKISAALRLCSGFDSSRGRALADRLRDVSLEISDIVRDFTEFAQSADMDEAEIELARSKLSEWLALSRKYGATPALVREERLSMQKRLDMQGDVQSAIGAIDADIARLEANMRPLGDEIRSLRAAAARRLDARVKKILPLLGFKNAEFKTVVARTDLFDKNCGSVCEFLFSANPGVECAPLAKIASSGELARVMLALKTILAEADSTDVLVFDEVDANVGGEIGAEVGRQLEALGLTHQVFCVTHLPQVAARGKTHFLVEKTQTKNATRVGISRIDTDPNLRVRELARMLGDRDSPSALAHAQKLLSHP